MAGSADVLDVLGIGFGPSNMALAVAMRDAAYHGRVAFMEAKPDAAWQHGMLLEGSDIQHNPLRDFSTPVNPRGQFTFCNYLHETGKFFEYLNLGLIYAYRTEFAGYVAWVRDHFRDQIISDFALQLEAVEADEPLWRVTGATGASHLARSVVVGTGRPPRIPQIPGLALCPHAVHLTGYLGRLDAIDRDAPVIVVGASQSAAEIALDLGRRQFRNVHLVHRSFSLQLKDTSPFSDEVYFPDFIDYYYNLNLDAKRELSAELRRTNYSSVDGDVLEELYRSMYTARLAGETPLTIHRNFSLQRVQPGPEHSDLTIKERYTGETRTLPYSLLVLATGFLDVGWDGPAALPGLIQDVAQRFVWQGDIPAITRNYQVNFSGAARVAPLYLNGLCEATHGMGDAGSFSLVSLRARDILTDLVALRAPQPA